MKKELEKAAIVVGWNPEKDLKGAKVIDTKIERATVGGLASIIARLMMEHLDIDKVMELVEQRLPTYFESKEMSPETSSTSPEVSEAEASEEEEKKIKELVDLMRRKEEGTAAGGKKEAPGSTSLLKDLEGNIREEWRKLLSQLASRSPLRQLTPDKGRERIVFQESEEKPSTEEKEPPVPKSTQDWIILEDLKREIDSGQLGGLRLTEEQRRLIASALPETITIPLQKDELGEERQATLKPHAVSSEFYEAVARIIIDLERKKTRTSSSSESWTDHGNPIGKYGVFYASDQPISARVSVTSERTLQKTLTESKEEGKTLEETPETSPTSTTTTETPRSTPKEKTKAVRGFLLAKGVVILYYHYYPDVQLVRIEETGETVEERVERVSITSRVVLDPGSLTIIETYHPSSDQQIKNALEKLKELAASWGGGPSEEEPSSEYEEESPQSLSREELERIKEAWISDPSQRESIKEQLSRILGSDVSDEEIKEFLLGDVEPLPEETVEDDLETVMGELVSDTGIDSLRERAEEDNLGGRAQRQFLRKDLTQQLARYMLERIHRLLKLKK